MVSKILPFLLAFLTAVFGASAANVIDDIDVYVQHGYVLEITSEGSFLLLNQDQQTVLVNTGESTVLDFIGSLQAGQYVVIDYDGKLTRSNPPQLFAKRIYGADMSGIVTAVNEGEITLVEDDTHQEYIVHIPADLAMPVADEHITVHYDGTVTLSLPAQLSALGWDAIADFPARAE
jgi:hypothetical protein